MLVFIGPEHSQGGKLKEITKVKRNFLSDSAHSLLAPDVLNGLVWMLEECIREINVCRNGGVSEYGSYYELLGQFHAICALYRATGGPECQNSKIGEIEELLETEINYHPPGSRSQDVIGLLQFFLAGLRGPDAVKELLCETYGCKIVMPPPRKSPAAIAQDVVRLKKALRTADRKKAIKKFLAFFGFNFLSNRLS